MTGHRPIIQKIEDCPLKYDVYKCTCGAGSEWSVSEYDDHATWWAAQ